MNYKKRKKIREMSPLGPMETGLVSLHNATRKMLLLRLLKLNLMWGLMLPILFAWAEVERLSKLVMSIPVHYFEQKEAFGLGPIEFVGSEAKGARLFWVGSVAF